MRNIYQEAMDVQDAVNLRAIARLLVKACDNAADIGGTQASYDDAAVILIVDKIESLVRSQDMNRNAAAWESCHAAQLPEPPEPPESEPYDAGGDNLGESPDF